MHTPPLAADWDVIVVGAGFGGLGCAALLGKRGKRVLLLDKQQSVGGYATSFTRKGAGDRRYRFDVNLQITSDFAPGASTRRLLDELGVMERIQVQRLQMLHRVRFPDFELVVPADKEQFRRVLLAHFPGSEDDVTKLFDTLDEVARELASFKNEESLDDLIHRASHCPTMSRYYFASLDSFIADQHLRNDRIAALFAQPWVYLGLPPKRVSAFLYLIAWDQYFNGGAFYIQGGGSRLAEAIGDVAREQGGAILTGTQVDAILVEKRRVCGVKTTGGQVFRARHVVCNAPAPLVFSKLIDASSFDSDYVEQVLSTEISVSVIKAYLGLRGTPHELGFTDHELIINGGYDHEASYARQLAGDYSDGTGTVACNTAVNPGDSPSDRSIVQAVVLADGARWCGFDEADYQKNKRDVTANLLDLASQAVPDLKDRLEVLEVVTPRTLRSYTGNPNGAIYGYACTPTAHTLLRPRPDTPVPGLYLAGAWTHPGPGVVGALASGANTARLLLAQEHGRSQPTGAVLAGFRRNLAIGRMAGSVAGQIATRKVRRLITGGQHRAGELDADPWADVAQNLTRHLGHLKGAVMKLGQMASYLDGGLPPTVRDLLGSLQDNVPALDPSAVREVFVRELGRPPEALFSEWNPTPIAAASIGQVHRGVLRSGEPVAVKVQYPDIVRSLETDLGNLKSLRPILSMMFRHSNVAEIIAELRDRLSEECDYIREGENMEFFRRAFENEPGIIIPRVYRQLSTKRILTTEFVSGLRFGQFRRSASQAEKNAAGRTILRLTLRSIFRLHRFNADPHPGNYIFRNGHVCFLDFGCVKSWTPEFVSTWKTLVSAGLARDRDRMRPTVVELGLVGDEERFNFDAYLDAFQFSVLRPFTHDRPFRFTPEYVQADGGRVGLGPGNPNAHTTNLPRDFVYVSRLNFGVNSLLAALSAEARWRDVLLDQLYDHPSQHPPPYPEDLVGPFGDR